MRTISPGVFALSLLLVCAGCGDSATTNTNPSSSAGTSLSSSDQSFVNDVAMGGMTEVKLGEIAQKNGSSKAVKDFGARMVSDHGKADSELTSLAARKNWSVPGTLDAKHQKDVDKFNALSGAEFDKKYIDAMVDDHEKDVKEVRDSIPKLKDADLKKWAQNALEVMESHLKEIKAIKGS